jgi:threonine/homoserine/homoserine lactone efflux protein
MTLMESAVLLGVMVSLAALPSSSVALVVSRAATSGAANGVAVSIGIVLGDLLFVALAIGGLSLVAERLGSFFVVVKIIGGLYLIWLGMKLLTSSSGVLTVPSKANQSGSLIASGLAGFAITLGDVKAIFFYASLFPVFVDVADIGPHEVSVIVVITILGVGGVKVAYALLGAKVAGVASRHRFMGLYQKMLGGMVMGAGGYLIVKP